MPFEIIWSSILLAVLATLTACGSLQSPMQLDTTAPEYLTQEITPCTPVEGSTVDPCEPDVFITEAAGAVMSSVVGEPGSPPSIRQFLDGGSRVTISHIVIRGTYIPKTIRCVNGILYRVPSYETRGYYQNSSLMQCYVDMRVNAYLLGSGPSELTVVVDFHHYFPGASKHIEEITQLTEQNMETGYSAPPGRAPGQGIRGSVGLDGREVIAFLGPFHNHATEVWRANQIWDVQRPEDGTVIAVNPAREYWQLVRPDEYETHRTVLEMELPALTTAVTAAHAARVSDYGGRIAPADDDGKRPGSTLPMLVTDANQLKEYYIASGSYNHPNGPPTEPIPACGKAVPDRREANRPLIRDCRLLLGTKDALAGTATLNWSKTLAIASWTGVSTGGNPDRVTEVNIASSSLSGTIPEGLADLGALTTLDLSANFLTGNIPRSLENLEALTTLRLSGNSLTGCIPPALRDIATHDLNDLELPDCQPPTEAASHINSTAVGTDPGPRTGRRLQHPP